MTAEVDVHRDVFESEVSKGEVVNVNVDENGNGISKDDSDGSYVFVSGSDAIISTAEEHPVESDLNGSIHNNDGVGLHLEVEVGENVVPAQDDNSLKKAAEESLHLNDGQMMFEDGESIPQVTLTNSDLQSHKDQKLVKEAPVEDASRDVGQDSEPLDKPVVSDPVSNGVPDSLPACHAHDSTPGIQAQENGSSENGEVLPAPVICENASFEVEKKLETEFVNVTSCDKNNGDGLPAVHAQEVIPEPIVPVDLVDKPEENGSCENSETCEKVPAENSETFSTAAENGETFSTAAENVETFSTAAENGTTGNLVVENAVSLPTKDVPTCAVDDVRPVTDAVNSNDKSSESPIPYPLEDSKTEIEAEGPIVEDTYPVNDAISEPNSLLEIESEIVSIVNDTLSSYPENDTTSEANSKSEVVDDTPSSFQENDAISDANSKSEAESDSTPIVDDTPLIFPANDAISKANSKSEVESEGGPFVDDTRSSCPATNAISEPNSNSEIELENAPIVDDTMSSCPVHDAISEPYSKSENELESATIVDDTLSSSPANDSISEPKNSNVATGCGEKASNDSTDIDSGVSNLDVECAASPISLADNDVNEASLPAKPDGDEKLGSEFHCTSALESRDVPDDDGNASESRVLCSSSEENDRPLGCDLDDVQIESDDKSTCQAVESTEGIHREASTSTPEVSTTDALEGQTKDAEVEKRPFYYLIRIPRYDDENIKEQIKHAQLQVEEKTKSRDAIRSKIQMKKVTCKEYFDNVEAARSEERAARDLFKAKRQEMDTVQVMINKVKNAITVEDLDSKIRNMEHNMEHETLPLKEEKQFIREIKQLKQLREQISSSLGKQDEVQQTLGQKDHIENRSKVLRKEMDLLRDNLFKAEAVTQAAKKKFNEENNSMNELLSQFRAADDIRQQAYAHLQSLRKQQYDKNKYFWRYKDDTKAAYNLSLTGDKEQLQEFCVNQVEAVMELWNINDDFRKDYIRCNKRSTLRRLRTADGRALGPDEEPPVIPDIVRATKDNLATVPSTPEQAKGVSPLESEKPDEKSAKKIVQHKTQIPETKKPVKPVSSEIIPAVASESKEIKEEIVEEPKLTKEEEELDRKAKELRKEEAAARLREQRRLEEKAKAKEALERKKKIAEKAQARAAIRAQKEAEEKEKEREKKEKKKERKKATTTKATNDIGEGESVPEPNLETPTETPEESETREKPVTVTKRSQKSSQFTKQSKVKSIPLPLRNRSKRKMHPWMWVVIAIVAISALLLLGNGGSSYFKSLLKNLF